MTEQSNQSATTHSPSFEYDSAMDSELVKYKALDAQLVSLVKDIKLLSVMSWPKHEQEIFLAGHRVGNPVLPQITYKKFDYSERRIALDQIARQCDGAHPIGLYLLRTVQSWQVATALLENLGSTQMTEHSVKLFGRPGDRIAGSNVDNIEAAHHFIRAADEIVGNTALSEPELCLSAQVLQAELETHLATVFTQHAVRIVVDPDLVAKAAAGPTRIRLRAGTCFSEYDLSQLLEHEAFVHSLTSLNGRNQTISPASALTRRALPPPRKASRCSPNWSPAQSTSCA